MFDSNMKVLNSLRVYKKVKVSRLQELYVKCAKIYRWMLERWALVEKITNSKRKESDPQFIPTIGGRK
ncbi:hypothetical protein Glove_320g49 [Diversispora epigaea]|uniref:Uncharacterized protein n=1 Tax=Diversispora epigaea TaxID=1348612 RepID=A0A397HT96_9GLOM|nr:hypothetical protein Glove_320g49 [Diversispora epigaea]